MTRDAIYSKIFNVNVVRNPNPLDDMLNVTYQWRLFMANDLLLIKNEFDLQKTQQITIVETGQTSLYFGNVEIQSLYAPNKDTLAAARSTFNLEIIEPQGSNLYDLIYSAAVTLGIQNWAKSPIYLELKFRGHDEQGVDTGLESDLLWTWRIQINQFSTEITSTGAKHNISGLLTHDLSISANFGILPKPMKIYGNTFLEMVSSLEHAWNDYQLKTSAQSATALTQYKFLFYEDYTPNPIKLNWRSLNMIQSFDSEQPSTQREYTNPISFGTGSQTGHFGEGWRVQRILDTLLVASSFSDDLKKLIPAADLEKNATEAIKKLIGVSKTYRIEPQVLYTAYDPYVNDYERLIIYHIWPYDGITPILSASTAVGGTLSDAETLVKQQRAEEEAVNKLRYYEKSRIIGKVYNYTFTGKNTDVLNFDMRFNSLWYAFLSEYTVNRDIKGPNPDAAAALSTETLTFTFKPVDEQNRIIKVTQDELKRQKDRAEQIKAEKKKAEYDRTLSPDNRAEIIRDLNSEARVLEETTTGISNRLVEFRRSQVNAVFGSVIDQQQSLKVARFAEDLPPDAQRTLPAPVPIAVKSTDAVSVEKEGQGILEHFSEGRNFMGAMLNQMYGTRLTDWMNIDIEIRGDPYWFGFEGMKKSKEYFDITKASGVAFSDGGRVNLGQTAPDAMVVPINSMPTELKDHLNRSTGSLPNYEVSEQCFMINFYTPSVFRDEDEFAGRTNDLGFKPPKKGAFISGIYAVKAITHKFSDGKFTQSISAMRDPHTSQYTLQEIYTDKPLLDAVQGVLAASDATQKTRTDIVARATSPSSASGKVAQVLKQKPGDLKSSDSLIADLVQSEGFSNTDYPDANGRSIGVGHLLTAGERQSGVININGQNVAWGAGLTDQQVTDLFYQDIAVYDSAVLSSVKTNLTQSQHDALVHFAYNTGIPQFQGSTLLKNVNSNQLDSVPDEFRKWKYSKTPSGEKIVNKALINRREKEVKIWSS